MPGLNAYHDLQPDRHLDEQQAAADEFDRIEQEILAELPHRVVKVPDGPGDLPCPKRSADDLEHYVYWLWEQEIEDSTEQRAEFAKQHAETKLERI